MKKNPTLELALYSLAFALALIFRFYQLGAAPLSDGESALALQAFSLAHGGSVTLGAQPGYILLTSLLFMIIRDSNFLARFIPAFAGSLAIWLPYFFRRWMSDSDGLRRAGIVMAFGLAIDPGLVSISRQVGSPMPAIAFTLLALASLYNRRMIWLGIFTALALLSGPAFLQGLLILALSWGLYRLLARNREESHIEEPELKTQPDEQPHQSYRVSIIAFLLTLLFAGTLLLRAPQGLAGLADTLSAYLDTWRTASGVPILRLPTSLLVYQLIMVIFALAAAVRVWLVHKGDDQGSRWVLAGMSLWALVAVILPVIYPGRQVGDLAWALIPLWALAASELSRSFVFEDDRVTHLISAGLAGLLCIFGVIGWFNLLSIGSSFADVRIYWVIIIGALLLGLVAVLLVIAGWSFRAARLGVVWSLCVLLGLFLIANSWGMAVVRQNGAQDLWSAAPTSGQQVEFMTTLTDLSIWKTGLRDQIEVVDLTGSPSVHWILRDFPYARYATSISSSESPAVVITLKSTEQPALAQKYRGQDFVWRLYPGWQGALPPGFINWLAFRQAPLAQDQVILWTQNDIFPGGASGTTGSTSP